MNPRCKLYNRVCVHRSVWYFSTCRHAKAYVIINPVNITIVTIYANVNKLNIKSLSY